MGSFSDWYFKPLRDLFEKKPVPQEEEKITEIIKSVESTYKPMIVANTNYRPLKFNEYIGQVRAKTIIQGFIEGTKARQKTFPHTLIYGKAGCGKTTLAKIISNELKVEFKEIITSKIDDIYDFYEQVEKINNGVFFMDEIHRLDRESVEKIYTVMEDFKYENLNFPKFTLIGATTEIGEIIKDRKPFYDRFKLKIELDDYTEEELQQLLQNYIKKSFPKDKLEQSDFEILARNCRLTPRLGISLLESCIYLGNIKTTLDTFNIIEHGYTNKDLRVLEILQEIKKPVGLQAIASSIDTSQENYLNQIEPFLMKSGDILRTARGRIISEKGKLTMEKLKQKINQK